MCAPHTHTHASNRPRTCDKRFNLSLKNHAVKINFRLSSTLKQSLKIAVKNTEKRLQSDQRAIRNQKKITKMKELLSSDENLNTLKKEKMVGFLLKLF